MAGRPWVLAIDYGTSNTVAAVAEPDGRPRLLQFGGQVSLPSAVYLDPASPTPWLVGRDAERAAQAEPANLEPNPKLWISEQTVYLAGRAMPPTTLVAATLATVFIEAWRQHDGTAPAVILLTYPATWPRRTRGLLEAAARQALPTSGEGIEISMVAEPVAAAWHAGRSRQVPEAARIAVLDVGAGSCDVAVVDRHDGTYRIAATPLGLDHLGGEDFDTRLLRTVLSMMGRPELEHVLLEGGDAGLRAYRRLRLACREAKEQLSTHPQATVLVPVPESADPVPVRVTRGHLHRQLLMSDERQLGLDGAAELVVRALDQAPPTRADSVICLVGGSSRIPLLGRLIQTSTGLRPLEHGDPGTAVAEGAAHLAATLIGSQQDEPRPEFDPAPEPYPAQSARHTTPDTGGDDAARTLAAPRRHRLIVAALAVLLVIGVAGGVSAYQNRVTCWEGSTASSVLRCPDLTGPDALQYIFDVPEGYVCHGQRQNLAVAQVAALTCEDPAHPGVTHSFVQWKNNEIAATELGYSYAGGSAPDGDFERYRMDTTSSGSSYVARRYRDHPFSWEVRAETAAARDAAAREVGTRPASDLTVAGPVPTTQRGDTECWDGSVRDSIEDCRSLTGEAAVRWVFYASGEYGLRDCVGRSPSMAGIEVEVECEVQDRPGVVVRLRQWASVEQATTALNPHYGVTPVDLAEGPARRWAGRAEGLAWSEWMYRDHAFSEAVGHPDPRVAAEVEDSLYARNVDTLQVRGGVSGTPEARRGSGYGKRVSAAGRHAGGAGRGAPRGRPRPGRPVHRPGRRCVPGRSSAGSPPSRPRAPRAPRPPVSSAIPREPRARPPP